MFLYVRHTIPFNFSGVKTSQSIKGDQEYYILLNLQPRIMHFYMLCSILIGSLNLNLYTCTLVWPYKLWKSTKFLLDKAVKKSSFLRTKQHKKNIECRTGSDKKPTNFGLKLFNGTPKFPYKFSERLTSPCRSNFSKPLAGFLHVWRVFTPLYTFASP